MRRGISLVVGLVVCATIGTFTVRTLAGAAPQPGLLVPVGGVPRLPVGAVTIGQPAPFATLRVELVLRPRDPAGLARLVSAVSEPRSPDFRHYLSVAAFADRFGAAPGALAKLSAQLRAIGLDHFTFAPNHLSVEIATNFGAAETALATEIVRLRLPGGGEAFADVSPPRLPSTIASLVANVVGLDSLSTFHPAGLTVAPSANPERSAGGSGTVFNCPLASPAGLSLPDVASAYGFDSVYANGDLGANETIALVEFSSFVASDISAYESCLGPGAKPTISAAPVGGVGPTTPDSTSAIEAELDIEQLIGLAPQAGIVVDEGTDESDGSVSNSDFLTAFSQAVYGAPDVPAAQVISISWGSCEPVALMDPGFLEDENALAAEAAAEGQTVIAAAGDDGSEDCANASGFSAPDELAVDDPASQPDVTAVGGSVLSLSPSRSELAWNGNGGAGGGGLSAYWAMPSYQIAAAASLGVIGPDATSGTCGSINGYCREVPDVSADAGTPYAIYCSIAGCASNGWTQVRGTSAATPLVAAVIALADASPSCQAAGAVGFANPTLYAIASGSGYSTAFNQITAGNNDFTGTNGGLYPAGSGYSLATGLGSPIAGNAADTGLVDQLCSVGVVSGHVSSSAPVVTRLSRSNGPLGGGETLTVTGRHLAGADEVRFGAHLASTFHVRSADSLTVTVPLGRGNVHIEVTTPSGSSSPSAANLFSYLSLPQLSRIAPSHGGVGATIVLLGRHFVGAKAVRFGSRVTFGFRVLSATRLRVTIPPGSGLVQVTVIGRLGASVATQHSRFRYTG